MRNARKSILFVCLGNICRSPLAEAVFRDIVARNGAAEHFHIDSAGTGDWHAGNPPDRRAIAIGRRNGVQLAELRARQISQADFARFDQILGMDADNVATLTAIAPPSAIPRIAQFHDFSTGTPRDVPDPYYGGDEGFEDVYRLIRATADSLFERLGAEARGFSG